MALVMIFIGLAALTLGAELLVRGASGMARAIGLPPLVIGLTVVAYGTSAPEFAVSLKAGLAGQADPTTDRLPNPSHHQRKIHFKATDLKNV